jgi:hypothetical protein
MDTGCRISKDRTASQVIHIFPAGVSCFNSYLHLTTLAPDIVAAILDETLPSEVTLFDLAAGTPLVWEGQWGKVEGRSHENGHGMLGSGNLGAIGLTAGGDW